MSTKSVIKACLASGGNRSYVKVFAFGAITAALFACGICQVEAQSPYENLIITPATGEVTLQAGKTASDYQLLSGESILKTDSDSGSFIFNEAQTPVFTNNGTIGAESTPVEGLNMLSIGQFVNNGSVTFNGTLSVSSAGLLNTGTINGNDNGGINSALDVVNKSGGILTGTVTTVNITNIGSMSGLSTGSEYTSELKVQNGSIGNSGSLSGYLNITAGSLTNDTGARIEDSTNLTGLTSITNNGTIEDVETISAQTLANSSSGEILNANSISVSSMINSGTIDGTDNIIANTSLVNSGTMTNGSAINANSGLTNTNLISDFDEIIVTGDNSVKNSGTLRNIKKINGDLALTEPGRIEMTGEDDETKITGDLLCAGGTLAVRIAPNGSQPENDIYSVNGSTTINGGTVEIVDTTAGEGPYKAGDSWTFLKSTLGLDVQQELALDDEGVNISPLLKFSTSYDSSNYYLNIDRVKKYAPGAQTWNQEQFGQYLDTLGYQFVPGSDLENVLEALDNLSPGDSVSPAARQAMAQMDGAVYGSMATMEVQNMTIVNNTLTNYLRPKNMFCCSQAENTECPGANFWGTYYGVDGYANADGNAFGGDYSVHGVLVGGDRHISPNTRLGGFFAFGNTEYQVKGLNEQADADSYKAGLYFVRQSDNGYLLGNVNYGWANFSMNRNISFLDRTNTASTSGNEWAFRVEKGFNIALAQSVFQPFGAFQYLSLNTNAFSEEGIGTTALNVDEADYNSYRTDFGGRLLWGFEGQARTGHLFLQASWMHEYGDCHGTVTSSFSNANNENHTGDYKYTVNGVDLGSDWCNLGIGGNLTQNNFSVFGGYDFMVSGRQNLHTGNVGLAYQF